MSTERIGHSPVRCTLDQGPVLEYIRHPHHTPRTFEGLCNVRQFPCEVSPKFSLQMVLPSVSPEMFSQKAERDEADIMSVLGMNCMYLESLHSGSEIHWRHEAHQDKY